MGIWHILICFFLIGLSAASWCCIRCNITIRKANKIGKRRYRSKSQHCGHWLQKPICRQIAVEDEQLQVKLTGWKCRCTLKTRKLNIIEFLLPMILKAIGTHVFNSLHKPVFDHQEITGPHDAYELVGIEHVFSKRKALLAALCLREWPVHICCSSAVITYPIVFWVWAFVTPWIPFVLCSHRQFGFPRPVNQALRMLRLILQVRETCLWQCKFSLVMVAWLYPVLLHLDDIRVNSSVCERVPLEGVLSHPAPPAHEPPKGEKTVCPLSYGLRILSTTNFTLSLPQTQPPRSMRCYLHAFQYFY